MQERNGYFFCLEDRALFCKHCDVSTHMGSPFASSHQRFLITGLKVALQSSINNNDMISTNSSSPKSTTSFSFVADKESSAATTMNVEAASTELESRASFSAEPHFGWLLNEMFDMNDLNCYEFSEVGSSRITSTTPWNSNSSTPNCFKYMYVFFWLYQPIFCYVILMGLRVFFLFFKSILIETLINNLSISTIHLIRN